MHKAIILFALLLIPAGVPARAEAVPAAELAVRSGGEVSEAGHWQLTTNGYVGAYLKVDRPGEVMVTIDASGTSTGGESPHMLVSIGDEHHGITVGREAQPYRAGFDLMPGTYFVRVAFTNSTLDPDDALLIGSLEVTGATLLNENTDALALAAADTYIEHGRRGEVRIHLPGIKPGTPVRATMTRLGFNLGANIPGTGNVYLIDNPEPGSEAQRFQKHFLECFNATVPSNAGKWAYNEAERDTVTMDYVDTIIGFAEAHNLHMRMHTLIWNTDQQPDWVHGLIAAALGGDADSKAQLREEITERIGYYARDRATRFDAIDVLNEVFHQPGYLDIFGIEEIAAIYRETAEAIEQGGGDAQTFINEFNILQWSRRPPYDTEDTEWDPYANWYREHAEELQRLGARLGAIGVQYYANADPTIGDNRHSPARIAQVLHNLSLTGLPIALTEFGVSRGATPQQAADVLSDTLRLMFGHPNGQTFLMFGFYRGATWERAAEATLYDDNWSVSVPGRAYSMLKQRWSTDEELIVDEKSTVAFTGFYGEYEVTVGGQTHAISLHKGQRDYVLGPVTAKRSVEEPASMDNTKTRVALIFDDGPDPERTETILAILSERGVRVTFGQVARNARENPTLIERVTEGGHEIINHSLSHQRPDGLDDAGLREEVAGAQMVFEQLGVRPAWYWPPFLDKDERLGPITQDVGIRIYDPRHLVDTRDYVRELSGDEIVRRATTGVRDGSVILFHEWRDDTVDNLPLILDTLTEHGCVFMTFSQLYDSLNPTE